MAQEATLEKKIKTYIKDTLSGVSYKWKSTVRGVPDQVACIPDIGAVFIEVKAPDGKLSPAQIRIHEEIRHSGGRVWVVSSMNEFLEKIALVKSLHY